MNPEEYREIDKLFEAIVLMPDRHFESFVKYFITFDL